MDNKIILNNEEESQNYARLLASRLRYNNIVTFTGDLGSGKTFFCREIIKYLCGAETQITSPTFNIVQIYEAPHFMIYHLDLYRLKSFDEIYELGIEDMLQNSLCLIEWPQIINHVLPSSTIRVNIQTIAENKHLCEVSG